MLAQRFCKFYVAGSAVTGFYRGWIADTYYHQYSKEHQTITYDLTTDKYIAKLLRGTVNMSWYATVGHPYALYRFLCRSEIALSGKNPYDHHSAYVELFGFSTLPKKKD